MPVKLFLSGEVAYASDVNTYLMNQVVAVFADASARSEAYGDGVPVSLGGTGRPALIKGMLSYLEYVEETGLGEVQYYDGTQWQSSAQFTIADNAVTTAKINNLAVTTAKINNLAVTEGKIDNLAVTEGKIAATAITEGKIANSAITTNKINDLAVTTGKLNDLAITEGKIGALAVTEGKIGALAVTEGKIGALAVTEGKIAALAVTEGKISSNAVTENKISSNAVTEGKIAANAVTASKFRQSSSTSVVGNATGSTANVSDIQASSDATVLRRNGSSLEFAKISNSNIADNAGIASTKFGPVSVTAQNETGQISSSYSNQIITVTNNSGPVTIGLPKSDSSYPIGTNITFVQLGTGRLTLSLHDGGTLLTPITNAYSCRNQNSIIGAVKIAIETWLLTGDLAE